MSNINKVLVVLVVVLLGVSAYLYFQKEKDVDSGSNGNNGGEVPSTPSDEGYSRIESGDFVVDYKYEGDNTWSYIVKGYAPTPCNPVEVDAIVMESFPEQVSLVATIKRSPLEMCIQVIEEFETRGTFNASEGASVRFSVVQED